VAGVRTAPAALHLDAPISVDFRRSLLLTTSSAPRQLKASTVSQLRLIQEPERVIPSLPADVRARALARARAALAAGVASEPTWGHTVPQPRWFTLLSMLFVASVVVGAAAYKISARLWPVPFVSLVVPTVAPTTPAVPPVETAAVSTAAPAGDPTALPIRMPAAERRPTRSDTARAELTLLQLARAALARQDFAAALPPLAAHFHLFRNGRFAEEREALRVTALVGLGRADEAWRAAAAFEARFPRSVLWPTLSRTPASAR
jgi:hypothetical protein